MEAFISQFPPSQDPVTDANVASTMTPALHVVQSDYVQASLTGTVVISSVSPMTGQVSSLSPDIVALISQTVQDAFQARDLAAQTPVIAPSSVALPQGMAFHLDRPQVRLLKVGSLL